MSDLTCLWTYSDKIWNVLSNDWDLWIFPQTTARSNP